MILLIIIILMNIYYLKKYEKGNEYLYSFLFAFFLFLVYQNKLNLYIQPIYLILEITIPSFLFFQIYFSFNHPLKEKRYLVILGCGLLDKNRISPLLMKRLDIAYQLYQNKTYKIIVSGGKGKDEEMSEASVMKRYLINKGVNEKDILCEEISKNTKENLYYSKEIIGRSFIVITSDYHALRVYLLSLLIHLDVCIATSKTIYYYKIYAMIREYIAICFLFKEIIVILYFAILFFNHYFLFNI